MDDDLTAIVAADEEARARVQAAQTAADNRIAQVRVGIEVARSQRLDAMRVQVTREVQSIEERTLHTVAEREAARARSIAARRASSDACLEAAAEIYARIVIAGPSLREST
jgi:hypothetical protein